MIHLARCLSLRLLPTAKSWEEEEEVVVMVEEVVEDEERTRNLEVGGRKRGRKEGHGFRKLLLHLTCSHLRLFRSGPRIHGR